MQLFTLICSLSLLVPPNEISYSSEDSLNNPIDHKVANRMGIRNGIFIEVGAHDGIFQSNTKLLEDFYGWTGVLVEPSPCLFRRLVSNRPHSKCFQCALGSFEQENSHLHGDFDGSLMSSIGGHRRNHPSKEQVSVRTLQSILDELDLHDIDFLSLDAEGYELNTLKGIDFNRSKIDYILIEVYNSQYKEMIEFMLSKRYALVENISGYSPITNPGWDGTHNDYLFQRLEDEG